MVARKFPPPNTPEFENVKRRYADGVVDIPTLANELNMAPESVKSALKLYRIYRKPVEFTMQGSLTELETRVLSIVKGLPSSVGEISRQVDRSRETVIKTIDSLRAKDYEIELDEMSRQVTIPQEPSKEFKPTEITYFKKFLRAGLVSDTQIGSKYQQLTLLHDAYADFDKRHVDFVLHAGDVFDGVGVYSGQDVEIFMHDPFGDQQVKYASQNYPKLASGRRTYLIGGQHDRVFYKRHARNIIRMLCKERKDLIDRGFFFAKFKVKNAMIALQHPGGGVAYARSYKMQKIVENIVGFISSMPKSKSPQVMAFGHWHIPCYLPNYMGVDAFSLPCFQAQTPYLAEKGLMPVVGYAVADLYFDESNNLTSTKIEFINMASQVKLNDY